MKRTILIMLVFCALLSSAGFATPNHYIKLHYQFSGIEDPAVQKNVNNALQNLYTKLRFPLTETETQRFLVKAPIEIENAVTPYGFFRVKVDSQITKTSRAWSINFLITPGPALPISTVQISIDGDGKNDPRFSQWINKSPLQMGQPLHTDVYENAKTGLYDLATKYGYFSAKMVKSQIQINLQTYKAHIILVFDTGQRARYGDTTFSQVPLYDTFLKRFLTYKKGQYYDATDLEKTQQGLVSSTLFTQVIIAPQTKKIRNSEVPITINLIPRKAKEYILGLGYGTDTGVRGTTGITLRHLGSEGHRFQTLLRASQQNSSVVAKYLIPGFNPAQDLLTIAGGASNMNQSTGSARNGKFAFEYAWQREKWKHSLELAYLNERYNITTLPTTSTQLVYPTWGSKYINADRTMNPRKGISLSARLCGASKDLLSETNFYQLSAHFKALYTIKKTRTRLLFRSDIGRTEINDLVNLPLSLQLFAGGANSVRGYEYNSIGPGRNLVVASAEVQERIYGDFYLAGFIDAGNVSDKNLFSNINAGTGTGIAWISSIGMLELTVAEAFTVPNRPWDIQFTMGTAL